MNDPAAEVALAKALYYAPAEVARLLVRRSFDPRWVTNPLLRAFIAGALRAFAEGAAPTPENAVSRSGLPPEAVPKLLETIHALDQAAYSPDGVARNLDRLETLARARALKADLQTLLRDLEARPLDLRRLAADAASRAFAALRGREARAETPSAILSGAVGGGPVPIPTGLRPLDFALGGGLHPGLTTAVAAPSGRGKTTLACFVSARALRARVPVVYFSVEMAAQAIASRVFSALTGSPDPVREFAEGDPAVRAWVEETDPILRIVAAPLSVPEVEALMRLYAAELGAPGLFVLDHLHRVGPPPRTPLDRPEVLYGEAARRLVDQARELGWHLWLVGQVAQVTEREWAAAGAVTAPHFKYSGDVVAHVDHAFFLAWHPRVMRRSVLILFKDRLEGKSLRIELDYDPTTRTFSEVPSA